MAEINFKEKYEEILFKIYELNRMCRGLSARYGSSISLSVVWEKIADIIKHEERTDERV